MLFLREMLLRRCFSAATKTKVPLKHVQNVTPTADKKIEEVESGKDSKNEQTLRPLERGGPTGPEPTRYGDWEKKGQFIIF